MPADHTRRLLEKKTKRYSSPHPAFSSYRFNGREQSNSCLLQPRPGIGLGIVLKGDLKFRNSFFLFEKYAHRSTEGARNTPNGRAALQAALRTSADG
jgi:hypothetical protein